MSPFSGANLAAFADLKRVTGQFLDKWPPPPDRLTEFSQDLGAVIKAAMEAVLKQGGIL